MTPFLVRLLWPALVFAALVELIFVQSQQHWILVTIGFALINVGAFAALRLTRRAIESV